VESLLHSGFLLGVITALIAIEAIILVRRYHSTGKGAPPARFIFNLAAGAILMTTVQLALWDASTLLILLALSVAGVLHLSEFRGYWNGD
jgi:hypothetical protein